MNYLSIEHLIFYAFLGITALAGSWGRPAGSFKEYVNANKSLGTGALVMTLLATNIAGGMIFKYPNAVYEGGIAAIVYRIGLLTIGNYLIIIFFIAPRIVHFQNCATAGDLAEVFFGKKGRIVMGIMSFYYCASLCSVQFLGLGYVAKSLGFAGYEGVAIMIFLLAIYTARGGMKAVTATDILHFIVAIGVFPMIAHLMLNQAGGIRAVLSNLGPEQMHLFSVRSTSSYKTIPTSIVMALYPTFTFSFPFIQRLLIAKHQRQSLNMYYAGLAILFAFASVMSLVGLSALVLYPEVDAKYVILDFAKQLSPVSRGLIWVGAAGIIFSTADSFLHIASISLVQDVIQPLANRYGKQNINALSLTRYSTLLIAFVGFLLYVTGFRMVVYGMNTMALIYLFPLIAGIRGLKTDFREFFVAGVATAVTFLFSIIVLGSEDIAQLGGLAVNICSFLGTHYYYNRGFVVTRRDAYGQTTTVWHPSWQGAKTTLTSLIPTPQKVVRYFQQSIAENSSNTTTLALFIAVSYMVPLFMHSIGHTGAYEWLLGLRIVGALLCVGLLLKSQWPDSLLRFFPTFYHLTLLYCFPFMTSFLFFLEGGSTEWMMNAMLSVMLFVMLLDYMTAAGLSIVGIALAMGLYKVGIGSLDFSMDSNVAYTLFYGVGFSIAIGVLFSRLRERFLRQANRRLVNQEAALEAHFPAVMAESERRTRAFQQMGVKGFLHTARKLHTIQHKTVAAQREQQALFLSLSQQHKALTQQQKDLTQQQQTLLDSFAKQQISQGELLAQQQNLAKEQQNLDQQQRALQAEFDALTQQQLAPQAELTAAGQSQAPQAELQTLAKHHLTPQAELNSLVQQQQDLQADLLPLVMQLQDLDTRGKDHLTLDVKKDLPLDQFMLSLQEKLLPRGIDVPLLTERNTKQTKLTADAEQLATLLVKGIASLQWLLHDQDQYLLLGIEDTQLSYPLPDVAEGYVKQVSALRITLTATEKLPPLEAGYKPDLTNFIPEAHQTFQAMEEQADKRLIKAHYGYTEVSEDTLIYVIPVDVYEVRPLDMDKPELAVGALPERANDHFRHETADAQAQEEAFLKVVSARSDADLGVIKLALNLIKWYHGHKRRHTQEPFYLHPLAVAQIVMDYDQDEATIVGALLHDTVEDTPMLMGHIEALFGQDTAEVVDLVTHLQSIPGSMYKVKLSAEENLRMLGTTLNRRGLYVKIADRMHNMRTINGHPKVSKRKLVAQETIDFFVPLAKKLGLTEAAQEFEKMCEEVFALKE